MGLEAVEAVVAEGLRQGRGPDAAGAALEVAQGVPLVGEVLQAVGGGLAGLDAEEPPGAPVEGVGPLDAVAQRLGGDVAAGVHGGDRAVHGAGREASSAVPCPDRVLEPLEVPVGAVGVTDAVVVEPGLRAAGVKRLEGAAVGVVGGLLVVGVRAGPRHGLRGGGTAQRVVSQGSLVAAGGVRLDGQPAEAGAGVVGPRGVALK